MREIHEAKAIVCWLFCGAQFLFGSSVWAAEVEPDTDLIKMIADCISEKDRDTRALGLQYVRDPKEVPGTAATKKFAGLLTTLPTEGRAGLLEALGDRGDKTALPAVLDALTSDSETVRSAALRAVGLLGSAEEVPLLADKVAAGSDAEQQAAKAGLIRIGGDGVNAAVVAAMTKGKPNVRAELLGVLAARNAKETLPSVLAGAGDAEASVRLAALGALRFLADEKDTAAVVKLLKTAQGRAERQKALLTLMTVCSRGREKCVPALVAGMSDADVPGRTALLLSLARAGGPEALKAVVACRKDEDEAVRDQSVRMLSGWPDPVVLPELLAIAESTDGVRHQVLAIRGLVRLAGPQKDKPADVKMLTRAMELAKRPHEKRLVLGVLGGVATPASLAVVVPALDDSALVNEAGLAVVSIAEKMKEGSKDELRTAVRKVLKTTKNQQVRRRAEQVLKSL